MNFSDQQTTGSAKSVNPYEAPQVELMLRRLIDIVDAARPMPLSASSMINKDEILDLLKETLERVPEELRAAKWLLKEREEFLAKVRREGDEILRTARAESERMVQRTEIAKAADDRGRRVIEDAENRARQMRLETEDYCDQKLASFEIVLERTLQRVTEGRSRLQGDPMAGLNSNGTEAPPAIEEAEETFFDQDID